MEYGVIRVQKTQSVGYEKKYMRAVPGLKDPGCKKLTFGDGEIAFSAGSIIEENLGLYRPRCGFYRFIICFFFQRQCLKSKFKQIRNKSLLCFKKKIPKKKNLPVRVEYNFLGKIHIFFRFLRDSRTTNRLFALG